MSRNILNNISKLTPALLLSGGLLMALHGPTLYSSVRTRASFNPDSNKCQSVALPVKNDLRLLYFVLGGAMIAASGASLLKDKQQEGTSQNQSLPLSYREVVTSNETPITNLQWNEDESLGEPTEPTLNLKDLLGYPSILIWGPQGSGKSTLAEWLVYKRQSLGHDIEVLDPHAEYGQWAGLKIVGNGMKYDEIDRSLGRFESKVKQRYEKRSTTPNYNPKPHTVLAEEMTQWESKVPSAGQFYTTALTDIRKIQMFALFVAHNNTMSATGGAKGLAKTRDSGMLEVELIPDNDPMTGKAIPSGYGRIKFPGQQPVKLRVPDVRKETEHLKELCKLSASNQQTIIQGDQPATRSDNVRLTLSDPEVTLPADWANRVREVLEDGWKEVDKVENLPPAHPESGEPSTPSPSGFEPDSSKVENWRSKVAKPGYPAHNLGFHPLSTLIQTLIQSEMTQAEIIKIVWGLSKGGDDYYRQARDEFKFLTCNTTEG